MGSGLVEPVSSCCTADKPESLVVRCARSRQYGVDSLMSITYFFGDATNPLTEGPKIICHVCNDGGRWGRGFVTAISRKWEQPEASYKSWYRNGRGFGLGAIQLVRVSDDIHVANMIAQTKTAISGCPPIRYKALLECLCQVIDTAYDTESSLHMPRIGCGLAGGRWSDIEPIIVEAMGDRMIDVYVYDYD